MFYKTTDPLPLPHSPLSAIISPRPIAWITTRGKNGHVNLAPYSFFNMVAYSPPQIMIASIGTKEDRPRGKDTLAQAEDTGYLCINIAGYDDREAVNASSANFGAEIDEAAHLNLTLEECQTIPCPRLANAPASLECRLTQVLQLEGKANFMMIAQIKAVHLRDDCITDGGRFDVTRFRPLTRLGYMDFGSIAEVFAMNRPKL